MALFDYTNPQGASDIFPFPSDPSKKIYSQEVNNMFAQLKTHLRGRTVGAENIEILSSEVSWILASGQAINITSSSGSTLIKAVNSIAPISAGSALGFFSNSSSNTDSSSSVLRADQTSSSSTSPILRLSSSTTSGSPKIISATDGSGVEFWGIRRDISTTATTYEVPTGSQHSFSVDGSTLFNVDGTAASVPTGKFFKADDVQFSSDGYRVGAGTGLISEQDATTVLIGPNLRVDDAIQIGDLGPIFRASTTGDRILFLNGAIEFGSDGGPRLESADNNRLRTTTKIQIKGNGPIIDGDAANNLTSQNPAGTPLVVTYSSTDRAMRFIRGDISYNNNLSFAPFRNEGDGPENPEGYTVIALDTGNIGNGTLIISFVKEFEAPPIVVATANGDGHYIRVHDVNKSKFEITMYKNSNDNQISSITSMRFTFIVMGQKRNED